MIGDLVARLIAAGTPPDLAAVVVTEAFAAGAVSTNPQKSADVSADKRRENDRIRKQIERENLRKSADVHGNPQMSETASITKDLKKDSKRQNRGTRLGQDWTPTETELSFAKQSGFSDFEISRERDKFRDYWAACAGAKGVKLDWSATWRQWIRNGADRAGKAPTVSAGDVTSVMDWDKILTSYKQFGHWSRYAGPDPDSPACLCPPEMLAKYGIVGDSLPPETPLLRGMQ